MLQYNLQARKICINDTINSGQVFLWEQFNDTWFGIDGENIIKITTNPSLIKTMTNDAIKFFRLDDNIDKIFSSIDKDRIVKTAIRKFPGLRLLRQNPFQCYISFIISSNSSIPNIKHSLQKMCKRYGKKTLVGKKEFFFFPTAKRLSEARISELLKCGLGYRAKFVKQASENVFADKIDFDILKNTDYYIAKEKLIEVFGIGNKVADCILLFSLDKLEAFPLDRWMIRILEKYYPNMFSLNGRTLSPNKYDELHEKIIQYFGPYAGYAQQFLFKMERDLYQKKWL